MTLALFGARDGAKYGVKSGPDPLIYILSQTLALTRQSRMLSIRALYNPGAWLDVGWLASARCFQQEYRKAQDTHLKTVLMENGRA